MLPYPSIPLLTERSIINFLVWIVGMILGPYLAISAVEFNFYPFGVIAALCGLVIIFGFARDAICLIPLIGTFIAGKFMFIPVLRPEPTELLPLALILYYFIAYIALQRKKILTGPLYFLIPILVIAFLIAIHGVGLRSAGGGREGGRGSLFILVAAVSYLCGVSVNSPSPRVLYWTPLFCVVAATISAIPYAVTTYFPGTAPYFYIFTDNINGSAYSSEVLDTGVIVRNGGQSSLGATVAIFLLAYFPLSSWWRPRRWWVALVFLGCVALVIMGGYRSFLSQFALMVFVALWSYYSWRTLLLIPLLALGAFLLVSLQNDHIVNLPLSAQRSLAFLPSDWDPQVVDSTSSSNDFRQKIQKVYINEYSRKSPWLGNGLVYDGDAFMAYSYLSIYQELPDGYYQTESFVVSKQFHTGWISLYDAVGIVGFAAFLVLTLSLVWVSGRMVLQRDVDRRSHLFPLKVWMLCNIFPTLVAYFTVFGDLKQAFPAYCFYSILWVHVYRIEKFGYWASVPVRQVPFDPLRTQLSMPAPT